MMLSDFPLWPEQASSFAGNVDALFIFLCIVCGGVSLLIFILIFTLAIKYRRRPDNELAEEKEPPKWLEAGWIIIPFFIFMIMFVWGAWLYFRLARVPDDRPQSARETWDELEEIAVSLLGPFWRREARLPDPGGVSAAERPLEPAVFTEGPVAPTDNWLTGRSL